MNGPGTFVNLLSGLAYPSYPLPTDSDAFRCRSRENPVRAPASQDLDDDLGRVGNRYPVEIHRDIELTRIVDLAVEQTPEYLKLLFVGLLEAPK